MLNIVKCSNNNWELSYIYSFSTKKFLYLLLYLYFGFFSGKSTYETVYKHEFIQKYTYSKNH